MKSGAAKDIAKNLFIEIILEICYDVYRKTTGDNIC